MLTLLLYELSAAGRRLKHSALHLTPEFLQQSRFIVQRLQQH